MAGNISIAPAAQKRIGQMQGELKNEINLGRGNAVNTLLKDFSRQLSPGGNLKTVGPDREETMTGTNAQAAEIYDKTRDLLAAPIKGEEVKGEAEKARFAKLCDLGDTLPPGCKLIRCNVPGSQENKWIPGGSTDIPTPYSGRFSYQVVDGSGKVIAAARDQMLLSTKSSGNKIYAYTSCGVKASDRDSVKIEHFSELDAKGRVVPEPNRTSIIHISSNAKDGTLEVTRSGIIQPNNMGEIEGGVQVLKDHHFLRVAAEIRKYDPNVRNPDSLRAAADELEGLRNGRVAAATPAPAQPAPAFTTPAQQVASVPSAQTPTDQEPRRAPVTPRPVTPSEPAAAAPAPATPARPASPAPAATTPPRSAPARSIVDNNGTVLATLTNEGTLTLTSDAGRVHIDRNGQMHLITKGKAGKSAIIAASAVSAVDTGSMDIDRIDRLEFSAERGSETKAPVITLRNTEQHPKRAIYFYHSTAPISFSSEKTETYHADGDPTALFDQPARQHLWAYNKAKLESNINKAKSDTADAKELAALEAKHSKAQADLARVQPQTPEQRAAEYVSIQRPIQNTVVARGQPAAHPQPSRQHSETASRPPARRPRTNAPLPPQASGPATPAPHPMGFLESIMQWLGGLFGGTAAASVPQPAPTAPHAPTGIPQGGFMPTPTIPNNGQSATRPR